MIDPVTALAGIQSAVKLIKQASKTVDDVASLGPLLGKYFNAKSEATKAVAAAKKGGSSMGMAIEIEMALEATREFEKDLQMLFFQANKMDVWQKIKSRAQAMDVEEALELGLMLGGLVLAIVLCAYGIFEILDHCATNRCGR
jgi:CII-binding regulator of phage lambda lysogenization HflD